MGKSYIWGALKQLRLAILIKVTPSRSLHSHRIYIMFAVQTLIRVVGDNVDSWFFFEPEQLLGFLRFGANYTVRINLTDSRPCQETHEVLFIVTK